MIIYATEREDKIIDSESCVNVREWCACVNIEWCACAIACHLAANNECCLSYDDSDFRVLARCRSKHHLNILEAMYIHDLKPVLCKQKSFVANLTLFKHAHSTHSHKHTE